MILKQTFLKEQGSINQPVFNQQCLKMKNTHVPSVRDPGISPGHKIEFFEVSSYGALGTYTRTIGKHDGTTLLEEKLNDKVQPSGSGDSDQPINISKTHDKNSLEL